MDCDWNDADRRKEFFDEGDWVLGDTGYKYRGDLVRTDMKQLEYPPWHC